MKKATKRAAKLAGENTFEAIAREWIANQRNRLAPRYYALLLARLEADIFPQIGSRPIAEIDAPELLDVLRKVEKRGVNRDRPAASAVLRPSIPLRHRDRSSKT